MGEEIIKKKITGIVENINTKNRNGLKLFGMWYDATNKNIEVVSKIEKGQNVSLIVEGKNILEIEILNNSNSELPVNKESNRKDVIESMDNLFLHSINLINNQEGWGEDAKRTFAVTLFIATKEALEKRGLL
jgi:hypothetical protein